MTDQLPKYNKPPVVETVMGVYFRPHPNLTNPALNGFWHDCLQSKYPSISERNFLETPKILFAEDLLNPTQQFGVRWSINEREPVRFWLGSGDGRHILQLQRSALLANWLKQSKDESYIDFADRKKTFIEHYELFNRFVDDLEGDPLTPLVASVRYINHIYIDNFKDLSKVFSESICAWSTQNSDGWLKDPDLVNVSQGYPFEEERGRLNVSITPARNMETAAYSIRLDLTGLTSLEATDGINEISDRLQLAHDWVVRGFTSLTTTTKHEEWGRIQ